ncbi:CHAP domain-containing protein [Acetobacter sp. AN02]|nr:CHAP domain-containing protein [Acetobacter sp. AN02]MDG6094825.1 CHAP domain-containing protein [Acetobacter sp. AN02]
MRKLFRAAGFLPVLLLAACGGGGGWNGPVQCAPWAREHSDVKLRGRAASWWAQASGHYGRSRHPRVGSVLVFRSTSRLPDGHVSVVSALRGPRSVLVNQANWRPGRIDYGVPVMDISRNNDWSRVRVWWKPSHTMGRTAYPTYGFILPGLSGDGVS